MKNSSNSPYLVQDKKTRNFKRAILIVLILFLVLFSFGAGIFFAHRSELAKQFAIKEIEFSGKVLNKYGLSPHSKLSQDVDFNMFWEVWDLLYDEYADKDKLNEKEMFYGALSGLVNSLDDPYTVFMDPKIAQEFEDDLAGTFEGIGAEIGIRNDILTIIAPLADTPAEKAGLRAGDKVYAIDGESTIGVTIDEAVNKIRGPEGTEVELTILRNGLDKAEKYKIVRGVIVVKSVRAHLRDDGIFVIKITNFNNDTLGLFNKAIREIIEKDPEGVILDLRNNPGGYLETAIEVASEWVEEGVVVTERFTEENKNEYLSRGRARLKEYPTVVLVNQGSASASEIVAGALKDYGEATIIGKTTFGKGSVQSLEELRDGSSVKITVAEWLTPNGDCINDEGIVPSEEVDLTAEDYDAGKDPQMNRAVELLKSE